MLISESVFPIIYGAHVTVLLIVESEDSRASWMVT